MPVQIGVIGSGKSDTVTRETAREIGREIGRLGAVLVCGGLFGAMEWAARGAKEQGGTTVGILPGERRSDANRFIDCAVVTGMGHARNVLVVKSADAVIALPGGNGTLSEIALALKMHKPVIVLGAWKTIKGVIVAETPKEAVEMAAGSIT